MAVAADDGDRDATDQAAALADDAHKIAPA